MKQIGIIIVVFLCIHIVVAQEKTVIFWDASWSMQQRNINKEIEYLNQYYIENPNTKTTLVVFNYSIKEEVNFKIENGNWDLLKEKLKSIVYDGATSFNPLSNYSGYKNALLFSDGFQNISRTKPIGTAENLYIINSCENVNKEDSKLLADMNNGKYINLNKTSNTLINNELDSQNSNDVYPNSTQLEEVIVNDKIESLNKEGNDTNTETNKKDATGYAVQSLDGDKIDPSYTTLSSAVLGKFSGIKIDGGSNVGPQKSDLSKFYTRGGKFSMTQNNYGLIVLDGVPLRRSSSVSGETVSTDFINPANIADITVLKGLAATNIYGSEGVNGVILITSKSTSFNSKENRKNTALLTNNTYDGRIKIKKSVKLTPYLKELKTNKNVADAYKKYLDQRDRYKDNPQYFIDVYDFFKATNPKIAYQILSNIMEYEEVELSELKSLLFTLSQSTNKDMFYEVSKRLLELYPNRIESYYDMAIAYMGLGEYQKALDLLVENYNEIVDKNIESTIYAKIVRDEIKNLIYKHNSKLNTQKIANYLKKNVVYDARLVFEWTYEKADFEIQIVNPQNKFFKWRHPDVNVRNSYENEIDLGFNKNQFEIDGNAKGQWIINVKYLGDDFSSKKNNIFLKCKVQYNFGRENQKEEIYLVKFFEQNQEENFFVIKI